VAVNKKREKLNFGIDGAYFELRVDAVDGYLLHY